MFSDEPRSLPDWIEDAYDTLSAEIGLGGHDEGLPREQAHETLLAHEDFPDEPADADYAIERLLNVGWLYEVDNKLRVTTPEE